MDVPNLSSPPGGSSPEENQARLQLLIDTGLLLARERSLDVIVQAALDAGLQLSCARFGAFFYNNEGDNGPYKLYKLSGTAAEAFAGFPMPRPTEIFGYTFSGKGILRSADITKDPRYGHNKPYAGLPPRHIPVCSYLAVPVRSRTGEVLGGIFYGHPDPDIFSLESESLVATIAAQAAVAIDNVRLAENLTHEVALTDSARELQRQTSHRLRQALDAAQLGTWSWKRATDLLDLDERAADLLDGEAHIPITRTVLRERIVHSEDVGAARERLRDSLEAGGSYSAEYRIQTRDGGQRWISARGLATFEDGSAEMTGMIGTVQDVTARKTQEATLRQSEKLAATGRLAATIAHEINNPLEAVTNLIYLSRTDPAVPPPIQQLLETADNELARVAQIAQQTLGFYRDTTRPVDIDMTEMLTGVVNLFSRKMQYKRIECKLDLPPGLHIFGLQGEVRQVFSNLLVNAIDASSNGVIRLRARRRNHLGRSGISVVIADDGDGIPAAIREQLFSPFFTTKESVGTGLGLWVTRGIVEKQGGSVRFRTSTKGPTGTVFRVFLPAEIRDLEAFNSPHSSFIQ